MGANHNPFALFQELEEKVEKPATIDHTQNPFLNQVGDDSIPWQEVKKRSAAQQAVPPVATGRIKTLIITSGRRVTLPLVTTQKQRTVSPDSSGSVDKAYDPHENWCGVCSLKFGNKVALQNHMKGLQGHGNYCNLCKRVFKDRNGLKNHVENAMNHDIFCNLCLSAFKDKLGLKSHFENNYNVGHEFACLTCLLGFRSYPALERHLDTAKVHTSCGTCHRQFRNQDERDAHWRTTTKHKHCLQPGCQFDGPDQTALEMHLERDHFRCAGCRRVFLSQSKLNQHMDQCTFGILCPRCQQPCAGQAELALHLLHCFSCEECGFCTNHEGNYRVHLTKHAVAKIPCWGCDAPMRTYSSMINHLESGRCPSARDPSHLLLALGKWWFSPLYMDVDIHAQLRTGRAQPTTVQTWINDGIIQPFICREKACEKTFGHLSSLILHCESQACGWDVARLNLPGLEKEVFRTCIRRDSASA